MTYIEKVFFTDASSIDLLPLLQEKIRQSGITSGILSIQALCPECCILATDTSDARIIEDITDDFRRVIPSTVDYLSDKDPRLSAAYMKCNLIGSSRDIPVEEGKLVLGPCQGIHLMNFYGSGEKEFAITLIS